MSGVAASGEGSGSVLLTAPDLSFAKWITAVTGWNFSPSSAQYIQYKVRMESDDMFNACSGSLCAPDIESVTSAPATLITANTGQVFSTPITDFEVTISGDCAAGDDVKFQVSADDGASYKYWNGSAWANSASAASYAESASYSTTSANIGSLASSGTFRFRALIPSHHGKTCELSNPHIQW